MNLLPHQASPVPRWQRPVPLPSCSGRGLYYYDGSWHWMRNADDVPEMIAWGDKLAVDFGSGLGVYSYNGTWLQLEEWSTAE